jgi:hypothetical protein
VAKTTFVRPIRQTEAKQFLEWSVANAARNNFDPAVASYQSTIMPVAYDADGPVAYLPIQQPYVLESLAPRPGATDGQVAVALKEIFQFAVTMAHLKNVGEIMFFASDKATVDFATSRPKMFSPVPYQAYRVKIADLENKEIL